MNQRYIAGIILVTILGTLLLLGARRPSPQWEYAGLTFGYGQSYSWSWRAPGTSADGQSAVELCKQLSIEPPSGQADAMTIANWAGSDGWELAGMGRAGEYAATAWFKRRK